MKTPILKTLLYLSLLSPSLCHSAAPAAESFETMYTPTQHLKNFALSTCLYQGYADAEIKRDALISMQGHKEFGSLSIEAFNAAAALADQFLAKKYLAEGGEKLIVMKCIDLFNSKELAQLAKKYSDERNARLKKLKK